MPTPEHLKNEIKAQLDWDSRIDAEDINVEVKNGTVILTGSVPTYTAYKAAADSVYSISGVNVIDNRLMVRYPPKEQLPLDEEIESNIKNVFKISPDFSGLELSVSVKDGWAAISGVVDAYWKKKKAKDLAWDMAGVVGVHNNISIVPTKDLLDGIIAKEITDAIDRNPFVNSKDVDVMVENGKVTLTGIVPDKNARAAAVNSAAHTKGVTDVENNLVILSKK